MVQLTGLTEQTLQQEGIELAEALEGFFTFVGTDVMIGHNISFDISFLREACRKNRMKLPVNRCVDTLNLARKRLKGIQNYKLETIAEYFSLDISGMHRVLPDCRLTHLAYQKMLGK